MVRQYTRMTWQGYLGMHTTTLPRPLTEQHAVINEANRQSVLRSMQESYPGNYTVIDRLNSDNKTWSWQLVFATPADETWFRLQYD